MTDNSEFIDYEKHHKNNKWGRGIKDPNERQIAYESYCEHIAKGKFKQSWRYVNEKTNSHWTYKTIEKWIKEANEFSIEKMQVAEAAGFEHFEKMLLDSCSGANTKANTATLQMVMRSKYGWDKAEKREINTPEILASYERVMLMLSDKQKAVKEAEPVIVERIEIHPDNKV